MNFVETESTQRPEQAIKYLSVILDNEETITMILENASCNEALEEVSSCLRFLIVGLLFFTQLYFIL